MHHTFETTVKDVKRNISAMLRYGKEANELLHMRQVCDGISFKLAFASSEMAL